MDRLVLGIFTLSMGLNVISIEHLVHDANKTVADAMARKVRVVCLLTTSLDNNNKLIEAIKNTWGDRCNELGFVSDLDKSMRNSPIHQHKFRMHAAYKKYQRHVDWFVYSSGGYILIENLRLMLSEHDSMDNIYFMPSAGWEGIKMVISRNALRRLVSMDLTNYPFCNQISSQGDITAWCLDSVGLKRMESTDFLNRERMLPANPYRKDYKRSDRYSDFAVSFDDVSPHLMYVVDYLIYQLRPFGINFDTNIPKTQSKLNKLIQLRRNQFKLILHNKVGMKKNVTDNPSESTYIANIKGYYDDNVKHTDKKQHFYL